MKRNIVIRLFEWMLVILLSVMVVLVFGNVVLRYTLSYGLVFSEEVSRFCFMWLTLIGSVVAMYDGAHLGMSSVIARLPVTGKRICRFLSDLLVLGAMVLLTDGAWRIMMLGMDDHSPVTNVPMGVVFSALVICSVSVGLLTLHSLWRQVTGRMPASELVQDNAVAAE